MDKESTPDNSDDPDEKLNLHQRIEMMNLVREFEASGQPEKAAPIREAFEQGKYFTGVDNEDEFAEMVAEPDRKSAKVKWVEFALEVSNIDPEIIRGATKKDLLRLLEVNQIIESE